MKNPPSEAILRVFGFVRNYASLDDIRQRVKNTLSRSADEDMNAYAQPFHHIGGSGTHFAGDAKTVSFTGGAPFPNSGFGMGPFNEKTTAVRDDLLDNLQRTNLPGWQGEWFDSYDIEKYLAQKSINLPQGGDGYVEIPPGDFYDNPLEDQPSTTKNDSLQGSISRKVGAGFNVSPDVRGEGMPMHSSRQLTMARNAPYPPPTSSIEGMLSIPAPVDLWRLGSMGPDYLAISQSMSGNMSSLLAYHNTTSLGFSDSSHLLYSSPTTPMNMASSQPRNKKVWFSVDKFIESKYTMEYFPHRNERTEQLTILLTPQTSAPNAHVSVGDPPSGRRMSWRRSGKPRNPAPNELGNKYVVLCCVMSCCVYRHGSNDYLLLNLTHGLLGKR